MPTDDMGSILQRWADGRTTLKEVRGYTNEEIYSISSMAYFYYYQGKIDEARTLFQGLYALDPLDGYVAKALGVVELAAGNASGALAAFDVAIKVSATDAQAYVGRAEVRISLGHQAQALEDLRRASQHAEEPLKSKVFAMLESFGQK